MPDINSLLSQLSERTQGNYNASQPNVGQGLGEMLTRLADVLDASQKKQQADEAHKSALNLHLAQIKNYGAETAKTQAETEAKKNQEAFLNAAPDTSSNAVMEQLYQELGMPTATGPLADASQAFQSTLPTTNRAQQSVKPDLQLLLANKRADEAMRHNQASEGISSRRIMNLQQMNAEKRPQVLAQRKKLEDLYAKYASNVALQTIAPDMAMGQQLLDSIANEEAVLNRMVSGNATGGEEKPLTEAERRKQAFLAKHGKK